MAPARSLPLSGSDQQILTGGAIYRGLQVLETAAGTARIRVYDGTSTAGVLLDDVSLTANSAQSTWYGDSGIWSTGGLFVDIVSGTVSGSIRIG